MQFLASHNVMKARNWLSLALISQIRAFRIRSISCFFSHSKSSGSALKMCPPSKIPQLRRMLGLSDDVAQPTAAPVVVGHRGALYEALENTRESFTQCKDMGCDAVELDVFFLPSKGEDGLIVFHGDDTKRPGDLVNYVGDGKDSRNILDLTVEEATSEQFNMNNPEFVCPSDMIKAARIPTLRQVLEDLRGSDVHIKIELKGPDTVEPVLKLVEELDMTRQCSYSSFDHDRLQELRELRPDKNRYPTGALFDSVLASEDVVQRAQACGASQVHLRYDTCTVPRVEAIHIAGLSSMAWVNGPAGLSKTVFEDVGNEDEAFYQALLDTGVQQLCVNKPRMLQKMLLDQAAIPVN